MNEAAKDGIRSLLGKFGGVGIGAVLATLIYTIFGADPKESMGWLERNQVLSLSLLLLGAMIHYAPKMIAAQERSAAATSALAQAVEQIAEKDERRAEVQTAAMRYVSRNTDEILLKLSALEERIRP